MRFAVGWHGLGVPPVEVSPTSEQVRVFFANPADGLITDGATLFGTRDGGRSWAQVALAGAVPPVAIGAIRANDRYDAGRSWIRLPLS